jgi:hypothetical protein
MYENQYPNDPTLSTQSTDIIAPTMPDLPQKPVPLTPAGGESPVHPAPDLDESIEAQEEKADYLKFIIGKVGDFLRWFAIVLEVTLAVRFFLKFIGADPTNVFAAFLYALTDIILFPFSTIVHNPPIFRAVFEITTLIGMAIYWLIFWLLRSFARILISEPQEPVE